MVLATVVSFIITKIQHLPGGLVYGLVALLVFGEAALFIGFVLPGETSVIVAGTGPTAELAGLLARRNGAWAPTEAAGLLGLLR